MAVIGSISSSKAIRSISASTEVGVLCAFAATGKRLCGGIRVSFLKLELTAAGSTLVEVIFKSAFRLSGLERRLWGGVCLTIIAAPCLSFEGTKDGLLGFSTLAEGFWREGDSSSALSFGSRPTG